MTLWFVNFLLQASRSKNAQGKSETYIEDTLEKFKTTFTTEISNSSGNDRKELQQSYNELNKYRGCVKAGDRNRILALIVEIRALSRKVADIQMNTKLNV